MFNPYDLEKILNSVTNPFYNSGNPVQLKWGIELTDNIRVYERDWDTCLISTPLNLVNLTKYPELLNFILGLQKGLKAGKFVFRQEAVKNAIEIYYETAFSKTLISKEPELKVFLNEVYKDINFIKGLKDSLEINLKALASLSNSEDDEEEEEESEHPELNFDYIEKSFKETDSEDLENED